MGSRNKLKFYILIVVLSCYSTCSGQVCEDSSSFVKIFGSSGNDLSHSLISTIDGGLLAVGITDNGGGDDDIFAIKFDNNDSIIWSKTYGGSSDEYGLSVRALQTSDSCFLICGGSKSYGTGGSSFLLKINFQGNILWGKSSGDLYNDYLRDLSETSDGNYLACGSFGSGGGLGVQDAHFLKISNDGNITYWNKKYGTSQPDHTLFIRELSDGNILMSGTTYQSSENIGFICESDPSGNLLWKKYYDHIDDEGLFNSVISSDSFLYSVGKTLSSGQGLLDVWLMKTDLSGNLIWSYAYGGTSTDRACQIIEDKDGNFLVSGYTKSFGSGDNDILVFKVDTAGDILWSYTYGSTGNDLVSPWGAPLAVRKELFYLLGTLQQTSNDLVLIKSNLCGNGCDLEVANLIKSTAPVTVSDWGAGETSSLAFDSVFSTTSSYNLTSNYFACEILDTTGPCNIIAEFKLEDKYTCVGDSIYIKNISSNATSYTWYTNNVFSSNQKNLNLHLQNEGKYIIELIAKNDSCQKSYIDTITAINNGTWSQENLYSCSSDTIYLQSNLFNSTALSLDGDTIDWLFLEDLKNDTIIYLIASNNSCNIKDSFFVQVYKIPETIISVKKTTTNYEFIGCCGQSYVWSPGYLFEDSTQQLVNTNLYYDQWVYLNVLDTNGCQNKDSILVEVHQYVPNIITPNNDGINDFFIIQGIFEPALSIYNRWGKLVYHSDAYKNNWTGENLPDGTYYYSIPAENSKPIQGWIQIER